MGISCFYISFWMIQIMGNVSNFVKDWVVKNTSIESLKVGSYSQTGQANDTKVWPLKYMSIKTCSFSHVFLGKICDILKKMRIEIFIFILDFDILGFFVHTHIMWYFHSWLWSTEKYLLEKFSYQLEMKFYQMWKKTWTKFLFFTCRTYYVT